MPSKATAHPLNSIVNRKSYRVPHNMTSAPYHDRESSNQSHHLKLERRLFGGRFQSVFLGCGSCQRPHWTRACQRSWTHRPSNPPRIQRSSHKCRIRGSHLVIRGRDRGTNVKRDHPRRHYSQSSYATGTPPKHGREALHPPLWGLLNSMLLSHRVMPWQNSQFIMPVFQDGI